MASDTHHALFQGLARAEVRSLRFERGHTARDHIVELVLRQGNATRAFRFHGVADLRLGGSFPDIGWLQVHDVAARQLDGLRIHVLDGEQSDALEFWAADVHELHEAGA